MLYAVPEQTRPMQQDTLGDLIFRARKAKRWTQEVLAEKAGLSGVYVGFLEKNKRKPSSDVVTAIAQALGADVDEFLLAAGFAPTGAAPRPALSILSNLGNVVYPPDAIERAIIEKAEALGLSFGLFTEPGFWNLEPSKRRRLFRDVEGAIEEAKEAYRLMGKDLPNGS